ncbi:winged helix-turn-helix domain-containing protein, partial [Mesorhizobium sp. Root552]|uniref:winged helix-turn-helix domain-containing protein n=1 Tax=Mesorhizobium sp. Root552 TaxID=1736555 RepID=UPI0019100EF9
MVPLRFVFGPFVLDAGNGALFERGLPVAMGSKPLALLQALVEAQGQVVPKSALMDAAWPNTNVEESNLTVQIAALRKRLRVSPNGKEWISTFPRTGYRFAGPLTIQQREAPIVDAGRAFEAGPSIAVLPFADMSIDPEQAHFADGLVDDLITDLSKVPG